MVLKRGAVVAMHDITDRKRMEEAMVAAASEWTATFDAMADGVSVHGPDYTVSNVNQSLCRMLGKTREELIGRKCYQVFHSTNVPIAVCPIERSRKTLHQELSERFEPTLNKWLAIAVSPILDDAGHLVKLVHTVRDITDRKRAEHALLEERNLVNRVMETSPIGIMTVDRNGQITYANKQAKQLLDLPPDQITQRSYDTMEWHVTDCAGIPYSEANLPFHRLMATEQPVEGVQHAIQWPDGRRVLLSINATPLLDGSGQGKRDGCNPGRHHKS